MRALHLAPHPDDEALGCPATLLSLAEQGVVYNLAVSLGRAHQQSIRKQEARESCKRGGFEIVFPKQPYKISVPDDLALAERTLIKETIQLIHEFDINLLIGPSPHDKHHGHEVVGRAMLEAAKQTGTRVWMWGLWADLAIPNLIHVFGQKQMDQIVFMLQAHQSEITRNPYDELVESRAKANMILGPERVFGFGTDSIPGRYAELLTEVVYQDKWLLGTPRILKDHQEHGFTKDISFWVDSKSVAQKMNS